MEDRPGTPAGKGLRSGELPPTCGGSRAESGEREITVVSGLPRCGTSMMMRMLEAGGHPVLTDHLRGPDADNPGGYYEFEPVRKIGESADWLGQASGRAVKIISRLLFHLPAEFRYKVIFMRRCMDEVLASQRGMLARRGQPVHPEDDEGMGRLFRRHLEEVDRWLRVQERIEVLRVSYNETLKNPLEQAQRVNGFLGGRLDPARMAAVVDLTLYRQRRKP